MIVTLHHSTDDTPPDLASSATLPRGEGKGTTNSNLPTIFPSLLKKGLVFCEIFVPDS